MLSHQEFSVIVVGHIAILATIPSTDHHFYFNFILLQLQTTDRFYIPTFEKATRTNESSKSIIMTIGEGVVVLISANISPM